MNELIAVVEDEPDISDLITHHLKKSGFKTEAFQDSGTFELFIKDTIQDLVMLDLTGLIYAGN